MSNACQIWKLLLIWFWNHSTNFSTMHLKEKNTHAMYQSSNIWGFVLVWTVEHILFDIQNYDYMSMHKYGICVCFGYLHICVFVSVCTFKLTFPSPFFSLRFKRDYKGLIKSMMKVSGFQTTRNMVFGSYIMSTSYIYIVNWLIISYSYVIMFYYFNFSIWNHIEIMFKQKKQITKFLC